MRKITIPALILAGAIALLVCSKAVEVYDSPQKPLPAPATQYVPMCEDADLAGPCVALEGANGALHWFYVAPGAVYPAGKQSIVPCATEDGGPVPCVWVPSTMGEHPNLGDSGAYVYR